MGEVVIDGVGTLEDIFEIIFFTFALSSFSALLLHRALLHQHLSTQLFQKTVGLAEQLFYLRFFLFLNQLQIALHILSFEHFQTGYLFLLLKFLLFLALGLNASLDLGCQFLAIFDLLPMPLHKLLLVEFQVLHALFMHHSLPPIIVGLHVS